MKYTIIYSGVNGDGHGAPNCRYVEVDNLSQYIETELNLKDYWDVAFVFAGWPELVEDYEQY